MIRSGTKRGLAASAVAALAVVGLPAASHAATVTESSLTVTTGASSVYQYQNDTVTVNVKGSDGNAFADGTGTITVSEKLADTSSTAPAPKLYIDDNAENSAALDLTSGTGSFTVASDSAGTVTVTVKDGNGFSDSKTFTVAPVDTTGGTAAVKSLALSSTSLSEYADDFATDGKDLFSVTADDSASEPVTGATINYTVTDSKGNTLKTGTLTTPTATEGISTYSVPMDDLTGSISAAGTYKVNLWVNNATASATPNADPGEPTGTFTLTLTAAPTNTPATLQADANGQVIDSSAATEVKGSPELPADGKAVTVPVSATVLGKDGKPLANAAVRFDVTVGSGKAAGFQTTTDSNGVATVNVPVTPAQAVDGDTIAATLYLSESPTVGAGDKVGSETDVATFAKRVDSIEYAGTGDKIQAAPGQTVSVPVKVADQFGQADPNQVLTLKIAGDNASNTLLTQTTNASGTATFTYTDTAKTHTSGDQLTVADVTDSSVVSDVNGLQVDYVSGNLVPATVTFTADPTSALTTAPAPEEAGAAGQNDYTVQVQNATKENLANSAVTVSVDKGFLVDASGKHVTSLNLTTDDSGDVSFEAGSTAAGTQNVTVAAGSVVAHPKYAYTYDASEPYSLVPVTASPAAIISGTTQKFVYQVTDEWGNPVTSSNPWYGADVYFAQGASTDPGYLAGGSEEVDSNGDVVAVLSTSSSDSGSGSVVATPDGWDWASTAAPASDGATASFTDPNGAGVPIDYTVAPAPVPPAPPAAITVKVTGKSVGSNDQLTISAGSKAAGAKVTVTVGGKTVKTGKLSSAGKLVVKVKDKNGNKKATKYVVKVAATSATKAGSKTISVK